MAHTVKNYIYFKGGSWGDIVTQIINNGARPSNTDVKLLKNSQLQFDMEYLDSLGLQTLCGHNLSILDLNLNNFQIVLSDPDIQNLASARFCSVNNMDNNAMYKVLIHYYPKILWKTIKNLDIQDQTKLLQRKYQLDQKIEAKKLDLSCIFDRDALLKLLEENFIFDHTIGKQLWQDWYSKQLRLGFVPGK